MTSSLFEKTASHKSCATEDVVRSMVSRSPNGVVQMPPGIAQRIVDELNFPDQRKVEPARVQNRLLWLTSGRWSHAFPITLARLPDGRLWLVDGQHRLCAIVAHDEPVKVRIIMHDVQSEDEARALFAGFDRSDSVRTNQQMLNAAQLAQRAGLSKNMTASLYKAVPLLMQGLLSGRGQWTQTEFAASRQVEAKMDELLQWADEARMYEADIKVADNFIKRKLMGAGCMAVALMTYRHQPQRAHEFWHGLAEDDALPKHDPRKRLIADFMERRLNSGSAMQPVYQPMLAWNAWNEGRELKIIRIRDNTRLNLWGTPLEK